MHLGDRVGTIAEGRDADFVVLSGPPFSTYTKVRQTWIDGKKVFDAENEADRAYRDGGLWLPRAESAPKVEPVAAAKPAETPKPMPETREARVPGKFYIRAGRIHTAAGEPIENGAIVIEAGVIKAVGPEAAVKRPFGATTLTAKEVTPGLIDPHTVAGISGSWNIPADQDQDETSDPNQADLRVLDGFNPNEPLLEFLRANGVSIIHAAPGRAAILAGQSAVYRTDARTADAALSKTAGLLVNLGEAPKDSFKEKGPKTRMGVAGLVRKAFSDAQAYKAKKDGPKNPKLDALVLALDGKLPVYLAAHRADDILTGLRIADEFGLKPVVVLGTDAYRITDELVRRKVPVIVHPTTQRPGGSMETVHTFLGTAAFLKSKGVPVTVCTSYEGYVPKQRNLRTEAGVAAANGLGVSGALKSVTIDAAKLLGVSDKHGSIEVGKVADVVLYDGDPFEHVTHVTQTILSGKLVYDRTDYLKLPFERRIIPLVGGGAGVGCCLGVW